MAATLIPKENEEKRRSGRGSPTLSLIERREIDDIVTPGCFVTRHRRRSLRYAGYYFSNRRDLCRPRDERKNVAQRRATRGTTR